MNRYIKADYLLEKSSLHHWVLARTVFAAVLVSGIVIGFRIYILGHSIVHSPPRALAWLLAGILYACVSEYLVHRFPLHKFSAWFMVAFFGKSHAQHHLDINASNITQCFVTNDPNILKNVPTFWLTFPVVFFLNYFILDYVLRTTPLVWFLIGATLQFVYFEVTHYLMHQGWCPKNKLEHHYEHHLHPDKNFAVTGPPLLDILFRTRAW